MDSLHNRGDREQVRQQVITLGLQHRMATAYTSFVAVDSEVTETDGDKRQITVSGPLPEGLNPDSFGTTDYMMAASMPRSIPRMSAGLFASAPTNLQGIIPSKSDLPAFLRKRKSEDKPVGTGGSYDLEDVAPEPKIPASDDGILTVTDREDKLKEYARTQNVNGSWDDSVDMTAAILLTFIREGHTSRTGNYRRQVKKALDWLKANSSNLSGWLEYPVKRVIAEHDGTALPPAPPKPDSIQTIDDLRLMAVLEGDVSAPASLIRDDLSRAWLAPGKATS